MVNVKEKVEEGWILTRLILEMVGKPAQHVKEQMELRIEALKKADKVMVVSDQVAELKKVEPGNETRGQVKEVWVTFAELEVLVKDLATLVYICFDYMPSSVEILEPSNLMLRDEQLTDLFTDLQARLLQVDVISKQVASEVIFYKQSLTNLFKNYVQLLLRNRAFSAKELSALTGVGDDNVEEVMKLLIDNDTIELKDGKYYLMEGTREQSQ